MKPDIGAKLCAMMRGAHIQMESAHARGLAFYIVDQKFKGFSVYFNNEFYTCSANRF